jgi:hypothetical protein
VTPAPTGVRIRCRVARKSSVAIAAESPFPALVIEATIDACALAAQAVFRNLAAPLESSGFEEPTLGASAVRRSIEPMLAVLASRIQPMLDPIAEICCARSTGTPEHPHDQQCGRPSDSTHGMNPPW